jgi:hypothetical protein
MEKACERRTTAFYDSLSALFQGMKSTGLIHVAGEEVSMLAGNPDRKRDQFRSADMGPVSRMQEVPFKRSCHEGAYALLDPAGNDGPCNGGEGKNRNPAENARAFDENSSKVKRQKICTESNHNSTPSR